MNTKILIIGQAPPAITQSYPYDTTMLYDWFNELGINKEQAQNLFDFDAVYDKFPGFDKNGGHKKPTYEQFLDYWERSLKEKSENCKSIIVLGNVAKDCISSMKIDKPMIFLIHPSKRNYSLYTKNKENILKQLKSVLLNKNI